MLTAKFFGNSVKHVSLSLSPPFEGSQLLLENECCVFLWSRLLAPIILKCLGMGSKSSVLHNHVIAIQNSMFNMFNIKMYTYYFTM